MAQDENARLKRTLNQLLDVMDEAEMQWADALIKGEDINAGDLVDWFAEWLPRVRAAMDDARASAEVAA